MPYTPRSALPDQQQGHWQAYGKDAKGAWVFVGPPQPRANAEALVATLRQERRLAEPHCVPL